MDKIIFSIRSKEDRARAISLVKDARSEPVMEFIWREYKEDKTSKQRGWFHILCGMLGKELGYSMENIKQYVKDECLGKDIVTINGESRMVTKSSEKAKIDEYSELIEAVYRIGAFAGVNLPPPRYNGRVPDEYL